jgi:glycosyltransferase involved in cell wall biosynthesis
MKPLSISLVIPAYNEEHYLGRLLDSVEEARKRYPGEVEVIVVDNGSTDRTREVARRFPVILAHEPKRCIACVRNRGGRMAQGGVIAFCDADNVLDERIFEELDRHLGTGLYVAGSVKIKFERMSLGLALTMAATNAMPRLVGFSGGFVFCTREAYQATGGYDEGIFVTEDAAFLQSLRNYAKNRGKSLAYILSTHIVTSVRKFDQHGDWILIRKVCLDPRLWGKQRNPQFAKELWYNT